MKKKIISLLITASALAASASALAAEQANPGVFVNGAEITFADQKAIIKSDRTLVPVRGVFEAMDTEVEWNDTDRKVMINSNDRLTTIILTIDDPQMLVYNYTGLMEADKTEITLDVAPQIISDRTLIPLRAISESLKADVQWDQEAYKVDISIAPKKAEKVISYSLSTDAAEVKEGEEFDIYVNAANLASYPEAYVESLSTGVTYNPENFEFVGSAMIGEDRTPLEDTLGGNNAEYGYGFIKSAQVITDSEKAVKTDGPVIKLTFKSLNGKKGEFALKDEYDSTVGYVNTLAVNSQDVSYELNAVRSLNIDTTPIVVNAQAE